MKESKVRKNCKRCLLTMTCLVMNLIFGSEVSSQLKIDDAIVAIRTGYAVTAIKLENLLEQTLEADIEVVEVIVRKGLVSLQETTELKPDSVTLKISPQSQKVLRLASNFEPTDTQRTFYIRFFPKVSSSPIRFGIQMIAYLEPRVSERRLCWETTSGISTLVNQGNIHITLGTMQACNDYSCQTIAGARLFPREKLQFPLPDDYRTLKMRVYEEDNAKRLTMKAKLAGNETCLNIRL